MVPGMIHLKLVAMGIFKSSLDPAEPVSGLENPKLRRLDLSFTFSIYDLIADTILWIIYELSKMKFTIIFEPYTDYLESR